MSPTRDFLDELADSFEETAETLAHEWRLDLAMLIGRGLDRLDWTQKRLSEESGIPPAIISRLANAGQNCTIESAARALFALNVHARIVESSVAIREIPETQIYSMVEYVTQETINGQENNQTKGEIVREAVSN